MSGQSSPWAHEFENRHREHIPATFSESDAIVPVEIRDSVSGQIVALTHSANRYATEIDWVILRIKARSPAPCNFFVSSDEMLLSFSTTLG